MDRNIPKVKNTVGYRLLKTVFSLYVIIAILITAFHMYNEYKNEKDIVLEDMKNIEKVFLKQLTTSVWNFDTDLVEDIISGILVSRSIIGVTVQNNDYQTLANFGVVDPKFKIDKNTLFSNKQKVNYELVQYSYSFSLHNKDYNNDEALAYITLFSSNEVIYNNLKSNFFLIIINSIIKTFALWVIFLFFANRYLTKPFFEIITVTNTVESQKLNETTFKYNNYNKNEFDILKKTFNKMFDRLKTSYQELAISNKKNVELNKNLEIKVQDRTSELKKSNEELASTITNLKETQDKLVESEKLASLGLLVSGIAHEINTPVGIGITSTTHLMNLTDEIVKQYEDENMSEEEFIEYLKKSKELSSLINTNLLRTADLIKSFKKISIEKLDEEKHEVKLYEYLYQVVQASSSIIKEKNVEVIVNCDKNLNVDMYEESFYQVMSNLIMNSIRHGFISNENNEIEINAFVENNELKIDYKDNGIGISSENLSKIFEPFFTTNREQGGAGLGLNIIQNIITKIFNGEIKCNSQEGKGVEFNITVPLN